MANVQNIVGLVPALGVDGQQVVVGQAEYLAYNPLSDGTVKAGTFCFKATNSGNGEKFALASLLLSLQVQKHILPSNMQVAILELHRRKLPYGCRRTEATGSSS